MTKRHWLAVPLAALVLLGAGCFDQAVERSIESSTGGDVDVDIEDEGVTYRDAETGSTAVYGEDVKLPADFPKDFDVYEDAQIISAVVVPDEGATLMFNSQDRAQAVLDWYDAKLKADGYALQSDMTAYGQLVRSYAKAGFMVGISATEQDGATTATVTRTIE